ncbi:DoxX family protein [Arcanobacterium pinnipediorum]|uniref:DoxX family protein n=1 Tax=Arcanobacterium pinnipediorum TaxID=1503041 RepID=A0ABY5AK92_9ACTO|nr:DoxX family protein [Arcanobacterium pinnipediorum]USR79679.1 DoxX family protein [Arcanobacterium pinnipediorum]
MTIVNKISRPLLAAPFIVSGIDAVTKPQDHRKPARKLWVLAQKAGVDTKLGISEPSDATLDLLTRLSGGVVALAGLQLARSRAPRSAALLLGITQIPLALANNPVWEKKPLAERKKDISGLLSAAGLIGGALIASTDRSGKPSVGWRAARLSERAVQNASQRFEQIAPARS